MTRTALIVGAGIGGLAAGLALRQAGWQIRIFERAASARELGFGLALAPNAMAALARLGVAETVMRRAFAPSGSTVEVRRTSGAVLKRAIFPPEHALGGPMVVAERPALHGALLEALGADAVSLGHDACGFTESENGVTLRFASGSDVHGDLLVGADGAGSVIRAALHPSEPPPRASGLVAVRGMVDGATAHLEGLGAVYYLGPGIESVLVRASATGIYWFVSVSEALLPHGERDPQTLLAHLAPRFDGLFHAVTARTTEMRADALVDRDPLPAWGRGRVTLLGDAAHPLLPHTGQGAAQALVDAVALGDALAGGGIEPALRSYEAARRAKTAVLVRQGRRTARVMRSTHPLLCAVRDAAIRLAPVHGIVKVMVAINRRAGTDVRG